MIIIIHYRITVYNSTLTTYYILLSQYADIHLPPPCSYTATASRLECITAPYPGAMEGESYPRLQSRVLTSGGGSFTSTNGDESFMYDWNYTPQVKIVLGSVGGGCGEGVD